MCGIVGYIGKKDNTIEVLLKGLSNLEYRGYDSAGIAYKQNNITNIVKSTGRISNLKNKIKLEDKANIGIGHTRWATHGIANETNCHPHQVGDITLVHNGIIENYDEIKKELEKKNYIFQTQTDTEVACALIDHLYQENKSITKSLEQALSKMEGSYAFGILLNGDDNLYIAKNKSPLIIGVGEDGNYIASDVPAILEYTNKYINLDDLEYGILNKTDIQIFDLKGNKLEKEVKIFKGDDLTINKNGYDYFMQKEMFEQSIIFSKNINYYLNEHIDELPDLSMYTKIDIVACGSAYHAGLVGKNLIEKYCKIEVNVDIASEYRYKTLFTDEKTLVILISQSGETADTLAALKRAKERGCYTLAIVNVKDSSIARSADKVLYTNAGSEIAVATTKAYSAQVLLLSLMAMKMSDINIEQLSTDIEKLPSQIDELLNTDYKKIANILYEHNDIYFLGRQTDYALALEGSLKLKEISYIHSEAYPAGELKHGTISLIEDKTPVISVLTDNDIISKTISNIKETKARGAYTVAVKTDDIISNCDYEINIPKTNEFLEPLLAIIPLQCIAFEVAKLRGCDIDKPKNLAKSVTVE